MIGTPQGGVISPLLANIYLHELDRAWRQEMVRLGKLVRYADDFAVVCRSEADAKRAHGWIIETLKRLGLKPAMEKTRIVHLRTKGIEFLGCHLRMAMSRRYRGYWYLYRWPNRKAMSKVRERIREITSCQRSGMKLADVIAKLNPVLRGWGAYFRNGNATRQFVAIDRYTQLRLTIFANRVRSRNDAVQRVRLSLVLEAGCSPVDGEDPISDCEGEGRLMKTIGKPCDRKGHARFERERLATASL